MNKPEQYISYEEHEKLKTKIKRACGELYSIAGGNIPTLGGNDTFKDRKDAIERYEKEVSNLKAQIQRLTKAGDDMEKVLKGLKAYNGNEGRWCEPLSPELAEAWKSAKENQNF